MLFTSSSKQDVLDYIQISKQSGIDLKLKSYWSKSGDYVNLKKESETMET